MPRRPLPGLPSREQVLAFVEQSPSPVGKREIARAFGLHGADKIALKALLRDMTNEGLLDAGAGTASKSGNRPDIKLLERVLDGLQAL